MIINTTLGKIELELFPEKSPATVKNFLSYVEKNYYSGTIFHRVISEFMIQGGGFTPDMTQKKTDPPIKNESSNQLSNERGTIAMARTNNPDSATSQFFINQVNNFSLDAKQGKPGYTVFGKVVNGMDVVDKIAKVETITVQQHQNVPKKPIIIKKITLEEPIKGGFRGYIKSRLQRFFKKIYGTA